MLWVEEPTNKIESYISLKGFSNTMLTKSTLSS